MKKGKKWKTAAELMAELSADPEFVARKQRQDEEIQRRAKQLAEAEAPLVEELRSNGVEVDSVYDLLNQPTSAIKVIEILVRHLDRGYPERIREGIIRALTIPAAAGVATRRLIEEFKRLPNETPGELKWLVGNALTVALTKEHVDEVVEILQDSSHGRSRDMLPFALARFKYDRPDLIEVLESLKDDPELADAVGRALRGESPIERD